MLEVNSTSSLVIENDMPFTTRFYTKKIHRISGIAVAHALLSWPSRYIYQLTYNNIGCNHLLNVEEELQYTKTPNFSAVTRVGIIRGYKLIIDNSCKTCFVSLNKKTQCYQVSVFYL